MDKPPKIRPSAFWWKCSDCKAAMHRTHWARGACFCRECESVSLAQAQIALWGYQWVTVAWMASAWRALLTADVAEPHHLYGFVDLVSDLWRSQVKENNDVEE